MDQKNDSIDIGMNRGTGDFVLCVDDVTVKGKDANILQDVRFAAKTGDLLAILGPTGSGKTTLLNTISGRKSAASGQVTLNQQRFNKRLRRKLGFVLQHDLFVSNLTLWEILYFTAMIRISEKVPRSKKVERINEIVDVLGLKDCLQTIIGDMFCRGLSGGEKKRASIACELLTDPDILLLDEPTSGLDSSTALSLMRQVKHLCTNSNKMIIMTIHQPSSQIYHMFDSLLLLASGQVAYFGRAHNEPLEFFKQFGQVCEPNFNPADFYLDVIKSENTPMAEIITAQRKRSNISTDFFKNGTHFNGFTTKSEKDNYSLSSKAIISTRDYFDTILRFSDISTDVQTRVPVRRWNTGFMTQLKMLTWRNFKQSRGKFLHFQDMIFYVVMSTVASVLFFQIKQNEDSVRDRMGLLFFVLVFWTFEGCNQTLFSFPSERGVISKERSAGSYRLSAYYLAKTLSELPLQIIMPTLFYTYIFWMTGLGGVAKFFMTWPMVLLATIMGNVSLFLDVYLLDDWSRDVAKFLPQKTAFNSHNYQKLASKLALLATSLGMFLSCSIMDTKVALLSANVVILSGLLFSGFITQSIPTWLTWGKYLSIINYPLSSISIILFRDMSDIPCNATSVSTFPQCLNNGTEYVTSADILANAGIEIPIYCYISTLVIIVVVLRIIAYFILRFRRTVIT